MRRSQCLVSKDWLTVLWQLTPVLLPGKSHWQRSLVGYSPWGRKELDMTEWLHFHSLGDKAAGNFKLKPILLCHSKILGLLRFMPILLCPCLHVLHSICQQIWKSQRWPQDWKRSVFIPFPKKGNAKECSNYCTIALISHTSKVILKILQARFQ